MKFSNQFWYRWRWVIIALAFGVVVSANVVTQFIFKHPLEYSNRSNQPSVLTSPIADSISRAPAVPNLNNLYPSSTSPLSQEPKYGHFPYVEADVNRLILIGSYAQQEYQRFEKLAPEAALALMKLIYAARDDGIWIVPASGFRSVADQDQLFKKQIEKRGSPEAAAKLSAPPSYSEHHTGYALDVTDGRFPKQDITYDFAKTDAFQWLNRRAKDFGFEMSFTENNSQGVNYEPWHWRFVGSPEALELFKRARAMSKP